MNEMETSSVKRFARSKNKFRRTLQWKNTRWRMGRSRSWNPERNQNYKHFVEFLELQDPDGRNNFFSVSIQNFAAYEKLPIGQLTHRRKKPKLWSWRRLTLEIELNQKNNTLWNFGRRRFWRKFEKEIVFSIESSCTSSDFSRTPWPKKSSLYLRIWKSSNIDMRKLFESFSDILYFMHFDANSQKVDVQSKFPAHVRNLPWNLPERKSKLY